MQIQQQQLFIQMQVVMVLPTEVQRLLQLVEQDHMFIAYKVKQTMQQDHLLVLQQQHTHGQYPMLMDVQQPQVQ